MLRPGNNEWSAWTKWVGEDAEIWTLFPKRENGNHLREPSKEGH